MGILWMEIKSWSHRSFILCRCPQLDMPSRWTSDKSAEKRVWNRNKRNARKRSTNKFTQLINLPNCFSNRPSGIVTLEYVTSEPLYCGMFGDESNVPMISWMKCTERYILQWIEVVDAWLLFVLCFLVNWNEKLSNTVTRQDGYSSCW